MHEGEPVVAAEKKKALHGKKTRRGCRREGNRCMYTLLDQACKGESEPVVPVSPWLIYCT